MRASLHDKARLYGQLYQGLKAGVPWERMLAADALPKAFAMHSRRLLRNIQEGRPLSAALHAAGITRGWEEQLLTIGEEGGRLPAVLRDLADFFETRQRQLGRLKAKLVYPLLVAIAAIFLQPLPAVFREELSGTAYLLGSALKLAILYAGFRFLVVRPFERAVGAAFNPLLMRIVPHLRDEHWLRLQYEVAYLDLLTLCLDCGLDAAECLKLLRDACNDPDYFQLHIYAVQQVEIGGLSLSQALIGTGLVRNRMLQSFLITSEQSGTLHSDMRQLLIRKRTENAAYFEGFVQRVAIGLYVFLMLLALIGFM